MAHAHPTGRERVPALDGLRGLAVAGVLAFHSQAPWARGGFLGVSAFFTLSGFLICSLLLDEHASIGRISLASFWAKRARRLLPAALVALLGVVAYGAFVGAPSALAPLRLDVLAALGYVANWRFLASSRSYAELFRAPSAAQHFWSLAIEEQFYVAFPLVVAATLRWARFRGAVAAVLATLLAASVAVAVVVGPAAGADPSRAYYGTDVRAAELLVGALLAVAMHHRVVARRMTAVAAWIAPVALVGVVWSWHAVAQQDGRLYDGGLLVHALAVAIVIAAAHGRSVVSVVLAARPLRWLGRISYGTYLYHWPLFLWLTPQRVGVDGLALAAVRLTVTFAVAAASFLMLEEPVRTGRRLVAPARARRALVTAMATVIVAAGLAATSPTIVRPPTSLAAAAALGPAVPLHDIVPVVAAAETLPVPAEPLRVYVVGDSVALRLGLELQAWATSQGTMRVWPSGWLACAAARGGTYRYAGVAKAMDHRCNDWATIRAHELDEIQPDVVVVTYGVFDVLDRRRRGSHRWEHLGEPAYDEFVRAELLELEGVLESRGARVVWLTSAYVQTGGDEEGHRPPSPFPEWDHGRIDRFNELVRDVAATSPNASVVELQRHLQEAWGDDEDITRRPDGIHPSIPAADELAAWLGPRLLTVARPIEESGGQS